MIRAWVPKDIGGTAFTKLLQDELQDMGCTRALPFFVGDSALHWCWWDGTEKKAINPTDQNVDALSLPWMHKAETDKAVTVDAVAKHLITEADSNNKGVKFFVVVPPPMLGVVPAIEMENVIRQNLLNMLVIGQGITETSMYLGSGFAWILIKGRVPFESYDLIDELVQRVNDLGVQGHYIRTYTYLAAGSKEPFTTERETAGASSSKRGFSFLSRQEADLTKEYPLEDMLNGIESDQFEVKASLKLHVDRFLNESKHPKQFEERFAIEGVLRAAVGFLNSQGGVVIIGAIERRRYESLRQKEGEILAGSPVHGDWIVSGVNWEYAHTKNLDGYLLLLADLIKDHIGGDASALVTIQPVSYKDRDVIVLKVPRGSNWYYLNKSEFYVRRSGSTISLEGRERESYQRTSRS